jgi:RHS repeat-associated protein
LYTNAQGQRVITQPTSAGIAPRHYLYDAAGELVMESHGVTGEVLKHYIRVGGQLLAILSQGRNATGQPTAASLYYVHSDHLGTPQALTDQSGQVVWSIAYDPFGQATVNEDPDGDGTSIEFNLRFPGQYYDKYSGVNYNYYRDYDPSTGRYIQSDPIGLAGGLNTYGYVGGNPINYYDPFGLAKLPNDPSGLGDGWSQDHGHRNPNGEKWDHESGTSAEWHPGQPGKPGWGGKDHWHVDGGKKHLPPGTDVPGFPGNDEGEEGGQCGEDSACRTVATTVVVGGTAYVIYRCVRMVPSLFPPLWPTIPANAAIP